MRKVIRYKAYDDTIFDNIEEGLQYDRAALSRVSNNLWFIKLNEEVEGFNDINSKNYSSCLESFLHTDDIRTLFEYFVTCPIVYCATEEAARVYSLLLRNTSRTIEVKGIKVGLNYWFSDIDSSMNSQYRQESYFIDKFDSQVLEDFLFFKKQMLSFFEENL